MSPLIPPRTYLAAHAVDSGEPSRSGASTSTASPATSDREEPYRAGSKELTYVEVQAIQNPRGGRRFAVKPDDRDAGADVVYTTVDAAKTGKLEAAPQALIDAREALSKEIRGLVQAFATSKKAGLLNKIRGDKKTYGASASATAMANGLNAASFTRCIDALSTALSDLKRHTPQEADAFVGRTVTALTMEAVKGLTADQKAVLARHMRNVFTLDTAVADAEPEKTSMAASIARDSVVRALVDAHSTRHIDGNAVPVR